MADIKTRDVVKGTIKKIDKAAIAADRKLFRLQPQETAGTIIEKRLVSNAQAKEGKSKEISLLQ